uniref:Uncharacterized protein n=1 Tax=Siphoviridae sp. ctmIh35 TaxID=2827932 RepID=A0A8S5T8C1_9CAUD|nr:MAG TPA: hypothetical protein [Siphoviridae sp. ctmIh35]
MTNMEKYKDALADILSEVIAVVDGKLVMCKNAICSDCLFGNICGKPDHNKELIDWLNAEYQEPSVDWSKVPIDTPVLASCDGKRWYRRYFAGVRDGKPETYDVGATSWSVDDNRTCVWKYMRLAEGNE